MTEKTFETEVWFRNPHNYIRELVECGEHFVVWHIGRILKSKIDPIKHASLYFGNAYPWRVMVVKDQGAVEYRNGDTMYNPTAVYPIWEYGEDFALLEEMMASPIGEDEEACNMADLPGDERPVFGQEHRIIVSNIPPLTTGPGRQFITKLNELQEDYPDCIIHLHNLYSYRAAFGMSFRSADMEPRSDAANGKLLLPVGGKSTVEQAAIKHQHWLKVIGFKPVDLKEPRNRCMFNIRSARWAAQNFKMGSNFRLGRPPAGEKVDYTSSDSSYKAPETTNYHTAAVLKVQPGDKIACDTCSLADKCKHFRDGAVCSLPQAEPKRLSDFFGTRDADVIIDGLTKLTQANARRLEAGLQSERVIGDVDKEVTKIMGQVFKQGVDLAKLIDPNLRGGARVQVNVGQGGQAAVIGQVNPKQLVSTIVRELEAQGYSRDQITPEMIAAIASGRAGADDRQRVIEGHSALDNGKVIEG
jgi:hypothetical protein